MIGGTKVIVEADGFFLDCPQCHAPIEEIQMHRVWENTVECFECLTTSTVVITLEL